MNSRKFKFQVWKEFKSNFAFLIFPCENVKMIRKKKISHQFKVFKKFWEKLWKWWSGLYSWGFIWQILSLKLNKIAFGFPRKFIRVIPQGTVDNNLGPDCLAGPKALDPNYCRQPTLWLHDLCLADLNVHGNELCLFGAKAPPPPTHTINIAHLT